MDRNKAFLYSSEAPNEKQNQRFSDYLEKKYNCQYDIEWVKDDSTGQGFRLVVEDEIFDWSDEGRFKQLVEVLENNRYLGTDTIPLMKDALSDFELRILPQEIGTVVTVGDGIATIDGLERAKYGEILLFDSGARGMVQNLSEDRVGCIIFDDDDSIFAGSNVRRTGRTASMPVGYGFLGRVVDALGTPIDGCGSITIDDYFPIEKNAPGIIDRQPVNVPLETGLLSIDSMFPIGRGQRELIIGDRQTGKTSIAIDTIINQKGKNCLCIYVAIGQKASNVAQIADNLKKHGAMEYTCIIAANASDADPLQYIAPYAGCALGEFFMNKGKDVLIVYDDLSKHAVAYRAISLLLDHSPGREAYPGDVFYLHSRLLERSARLCADKGGGSITALPIVETLGGDVSAYIPTNIISITDGQIYLESSLFFSGQRPAVNVGLSVSRVGGDAQTKAMKKAVGTLRLDLAQYREMEVFTQFSSDLDETTKKQLTYGAGLMQMLRQVQYHPYSQHQQVIMLVSALSHNLEAIAIDAISLFNRELLDMFEQHHPDICKIIDNTNTLEDSVRKDISEISRIFVSDWIENHPNRVNK